MSHDGPSSASRAQAPINSSVDGTVLHRLCPASADETHVIEVSARGFDLSMRVSCVFRVNWT